MQEELDAMIREIDEDGNGEIDFDEFVQVLVLPSVSTFPYFLAAEKSGREGGCGGFREGEYAREGLWRQTKDSRSRETQRG